MGARNAAETWTHTRAGKLGVVCAGHAAVLAAELDRCALGERDRIPDDLTVAPAQVDMLTMMLLSVASGMKLTKYSPATGEISMSGHIGALTSSEHPVLGGLLHYTPTMLSTKAANMLALQFAPHARAVGQRDGVRANAVVGKFKDRSTGRGFVPLQVLYLAKLDIVRESGWPEQRNGFAASFIAFGTVDVHDAVPPTCIRRCVGTFAETIVKAHLYQIQGKAGLDYPAWLVTQREAFIKRSGGSSQFLDWDWFGADVLKPFGGFEAPYVESHTHSPINETKNGKQKEAAGGPIESFKSAALANLELIDCCLKLKEDDDPSSFVPVTAAYEVILCCDRSMYSIKKRNPLPLFENLALNLVAKSTRLLLETRPPSWRLAPLVSKEWLSLLDNAINKVREEYDKRDPRGQFDSEAGFEDMVAYTRLFILRAAYFTVILLTAQELGPGLQGNADPVTALAYLA